MREYIINVLKINKGTILIILVPTFVLLIPLLAMQFTDEVNWDRTDFSVAWILMISVGLTYKLAVRRAGNFLYRAAVGLALAAAFILIWVNLAVGIIGPENNPANLMYLGVLAVGITGAGFARLKPPGMARAMFAAAIAQTLIAIIALSAGMDKYPDSSLPGILMINGFFVALILGSAWLFHRSANKPS